MSDKNKQYIFLKDPVNLSIKEVSFDLPIGYEGFSKINKSLKKQGMNTWNIEKAFSVEDEKGEKLLQKTRKEFGL